ncbi:MAG: hypothetical protein WAO28_01755 [Candidatus Microsaccharimonas sp.]
MPKKTKHIVSKKNKIFVAGSIALIVALVLTLVLTQLVPYSQNTARKQRILNIYSSLNLGDDYILQGCDIFGDKRIYSWDDGRSYSSSCTYIRAANVDTTITELKKANTDAGYVLFDESYGGGQQHFKTAKNEYIRVGVTSKSRDDAYQNAFLTGQSTEPAANMDMNAGPSNVTIKVNLDDNNE